MQEQEDIYGAYGKDRPSVKDLDMVEGRMYSLLKNNTQTLQELMAFAANHSTEELVQKLHQQYPDYKDYITPARVSAVWRVIQAEQQPQTDKHGTLAQSQTSADPIVKDRDTGPLDGIKNKFGNMLGSMFGGPKLVPKSNPGPTPQAYTTPTHERSAIEKMRDKVADFDEDYKDIGERVLGGFTQFIAYVGPFLLMAWIGADLGKFFAPTMDTIPAYGLAFTIEGVIAACTVAMGRAFAEISSGKANFGKTLAVVCIWLILNSSSAFGLYLVITHNNQVPQGSIEQFSMIIRVVAVALADLGCSAVLMFKGRSLQKHIDSIRKRATAIGELADAQRSIEEADKNAALREQMMKATLQIQEDLSEKIGDAVSMVMTSILDKMEKALKDEDKNERGYGRR